MIKKLIFFTNILLCLINISVVLSQENKTLLIKRDRDSRDIDEFDDGLKDEYLKGKIKSITITDCVETTDEKKKKIVVTRYINVINFDSSGIVKDVNRKYFIDFQRIYLKEYIIKYDKKGNEIESFYYENGKLFSKDTSIYNSENKKIKYKYLLVSNYSYTDTFNYNKDGYIVYRNFTELRPGIYSDFRKAKRIYNNIGELQESISYNIDGLILEKYKPDKRFAKNKSGKTKNFYSLFGRLTKTVTYYKHPKNDANKYLSNGRIVTKYNRKGNVKVYKTITGWELQKKLKFTYNKKQQLIYESEKQKRYGFLEFFTYDHCVNHFTYDDTGNITKIIKSCELGHVCRVYINLRKIEYY